MKLKLMPGVKHPQAAARNMGSVPKEMRTKLNDLVSIEMFAPGPTQKYRHQGLW